LGLYFRFPQVVRIDEKKTYGFVASDTAFAVFFIMR